MALLIPFFVIVAALVASGVATIHASQHGTPGTSGFWDAFFHDNIVSQALGLAGKAIRSIISRYAAAHLKLLTAYFHEMARLQKERYTAMRAHAAATARVAAAAERAIPREAHKAAAPALARAKVADRHATRALGLEHATAKELHRFRAQTRARLKADAHAIDVTIPHDIAGLRQRTRAVEDAQAKQRDAIGSIEHGAADTWDWIRTHPLSSVTGLFAGAVVVALSRLGYGFLRCSSWRNVGKRLNCGMGSSLLKLLDGGLPALLGMFLTVEATAHFRDLVKAGQEVEHGVAEGIKELLNVVE